MFAYGATGAGKTYTMLGTMESPGITFSAVMALFSQIDDCKNDRVYDVSVSYLEVLLCCAVNISVSKLEIMALIFFRICNSRTLRYLHCLIDVSVSYLEIHLCISAILWTYLSFTVWYFLV